MKFAISTVILATLATVQSGRGRTNTRVITADADGDDFLYGTFPNDFKWGFATAAYQIEEAWNEDGKGLNIWDTFTHSIPSPVVDNSAGDVACNSYHKYKEDVQLLKSMGADFYHLSISWSRVIPTGRLADGVNPAGLRYYDNLINELGANGIEPFVTLYHWDLPQGLQDDGGWLNETIVGHFEDFARLTYVYYGDRVKKWITFNEAIDVCWQGYGIGQKAPGLKLPAMGAYDCMHNLLKSHAMAYRVYEAKFKAIQKGIVGMTVYGAWHEPENADDPKHVAAAERANMFLHGWIFYPIVFGDYPPIMRQLVDAKSSAESLPQSRLPVFTEVWKQKLNHSWDFLGQNHYTSALAIPAVRTDPGFLGDQNTITFQPADWPATGSEWLKVAPWGFRKLLNWIKNTYGNPIVYIRENG